METKEALEKLQDILGPSEGILESLQYLLFPCFFRDDENDEEPYHLEDVLDKENKEIARLYKKVRVSYDKLMDNIFELDKSLFAKPVQLNKE